MCSNPSFLPRASQFSLYLTRATWNHRWIQDIVVMESIFLNCSEHSEGLIFSNVFNPFSPVVDGDQPSASFHQPA